MRYVKMLLDTWPTIRSNGKRSCIRPTHSLSTFNVYNTFWQSLFVNKDNIFYKNPKHRKTLQCFCRKPWYIPMIYQSIYPRFVMYSSVLKVFANSQSCLLANSKIHECLKLFPIQSILLFRRVVFSRMNKISEKRGQLRETEGSEYPEYG